MARFSELKKFKVVLTSGNIIGAILDKYKYYFKTYDNPCIKCVDMYKENLDSSSIKEYVFYKTLNIEKIN